MSDWKKITLADLEMLPVGHRQKIPEDYLDANNHMNVILRAFTLTRLAHQIYREKPPLFDVLRN